ncbi:MAG TPA: LysR family transcriptional regulator [Accumulibacter sp.]|jgi:DNA-binding transcriptional LysR family regulator|nr:LysR family transcriptional regulator [Accumulibacter sp.]HQC79957.1 LysR family transcriptional regulator [Accumulibacter sp.]
MNLRFVEAFVWVARLQSLTRTAEKLFLTQSAVSSRINALEEELGVPLIDRRDRVFRLTSAGTRFLDYAERFLALQLDLKRELGSPEQLPLALRVGGIETVLHIWMIPLMESLKADYPKIEFELNVEMTHVLNEQVRRGGLDLVFSALPAVGQGITNVALEPVEMIFVGPSTMDGAMRLSIHALLETELLTFQRGSQPHVALLESLARAGVSDKRVHTISSISALVKLVESGFGLATLPRAAAIELRKRHRIVPLNCELLLQSLPLYANYWSYSGAPELNEAIAKALMFARRIHLPNQE